MSGGATSGKAVMGLFLFLVVAAAAPPLAAQVCTNDLQGPDDEPGQKDLNQFCANGACAAGSSYSYNFDDTAWSGNNSGDACLLFDTDGDGNANRAVCTTVVGNAALQPGNPRCYICADDRPNRCSGAMPVPCTSSCTVTVSSDPFPNPPVASHTQCSGPNCLLQDARVSCCVTPGDDGGVLLDVCSYPSQQPNSDPSDCIRQPDQCATNADCDDGNACTADECVAAPGPDFCRSTAGNPGAVCRASAGQCDAAEVCTGTSVECPADVLAPAGTLCRGPEGQCDVAEMCTGTSAQCPADAVAPATTPCIGASQGGVCDGIDHCSGTSNACVDEFQGAGVVCRADTGQCDVAEACTGTSGQCPADAFEPAGAACGSGADGICDNPDSCDGSGACQANNEPTTTVCRPDAGECDVAEMCAPGGVCPADVFETPGTACGDGGDTICDNPDSCDATGTCRANNEPTTTVCRPDSGQCDVAETCAAGGVCPADTFEPATTTCAGTSQGGVCDGIDHCSGTSNACVDEFQGPTVICRADTGQCDVEERCTGTAGACPADAFEPAATACTGTSQGGACDGTDHCSGTSTACVDEFQGPGVVCRADAGQCDVEERCTGATGACPADAFEPATTTCTGASNGGACDATDHCSGTGNGCLDQFAGPETVCREDAGECDLEERCTGATGACPADTFEPAGVSCGSGNDDACDNPDSCDGVGGCRPNYEPEGTPCNEGDVCTAPDACDPHGHCEAGPVVGGCKVTGGGQLTAYGSLAWVSFGFNAQTGGGLVKGHLEYNRHSAPKAAYHSLEVLTLAVTPIAACTADPARSGQKATFTGTIRRKGQSEACTFEVVVEDCGEPGTSDFFSIDIEGPASCPESRSGTLDRGNIQVH